MREIIPILRARRERRLARLGKKEAGRRGAVVSLGVLFSLFAAAVILAAALGYADLTRELPSIEELPRLLNPPDGLLLTPTRIYDRSGEHVLVTFGIDDSPRSYVYLDQAQPQHMAHVFSEAVVALQDPLFWKHSGYAINGWRDPGLHPTIAQKLVSDLLLFDEKPSIRRALRERILAAQVIARYGRPQVLEWYLNSADFGNYAFGVEAAAQIYFAKPASKLSLMESVVLAAVMDAPNLNPLDTPEISIERAHQAIQDLQEGGYLTPEQASPALEERISFRSSSSLPPRQAEAFVNLALAQLQSRFSRARIERGGLSVITTLDYELQQQASCITTTFAARMQAASDPQVECSLLRYLAALPPGMLVSQGSASAMIVDPSSGQVLAAVGETMSGTETALLAAHQPGSLLSPFIYLTGLTRGLSPASLVWDIPGTEDLVSDDTQYHGPMRLRLALANDYQVPVETVRQQVGSQNVNQILKSFGLPVEDPPHLLELAGAYGALGTQGVYFGQSFEDAFAPTTVLRLEAADGSLWIDWSAAQARPVVSPGLAYLITNMLSDEPARWPSLGSPNVLEIGRPAGVKLGQTADGLNAWTAGYTPQSVVVVWVGTRGDTPVSTRFPAALWSALMQAASQDLPRDGWALPEGVTVMDVCDPSGLLPTRDCPNIVSEVFLQGSEPIQSDWLYRSYQVNRETGALATVFTPPQFIEERVYLMVPDEAKSWAEQAGIPSPPNSYDAIQPPAVNPDVNISRPVLFADVSGIVQITGTAAGADFDHYRLQVGQGLNPQEWIQIGEDHTIAVEDGVLAEWDTSGLSGLYAVQLVVVRTDQRVETAVTQVTIISPQ